MPDNGRGDAKISTVSGDFLSSQTSRIVESDSESDTSGKGHNEICIAVVFPLPKSRGTAIVRVPVSQLEARLEKEGYSQCFTCNTEVICG
jgi:hypothetical protein